MNCWFCVFHFQGQKDGGRQQEIHGPDAEGVQAEPAPPPQVPGACISGCLDSGARRTILTAGGDGHVHDNLFLVEAQA